MVHHPDLSPASRGRAGRKLHQREDGLASLGTLRGGALFHWRQGSAPGASLQQPTREDGGRAGEARATLTATGPLVTLVGAVQEAVAALGQQDAGLAVLTWELLARTGQGAACG